MEKKSVAGIENLAAQGRGLMRAARTAVLSTLLPSENAAQGGPYGSLVLSATCPDVTPILLLSRLAVHTSNLLQDARAGLLYDGTTALEDPLTGPRLSVAGSAQATPADEIPHDRARFLARHPTAARYADFADFAFYRLIPERAHLVAGFGKINWISGADLRLPAQDCKVLAEAEADILAHMNEDHSQTVAQYAQTLLGQEAGPWRLAGIDPEGCDLALRGARVRLPFGAKVMNAEQARQEFVRLAQLSRQATA